ncbi:hypothetical protein [Actinomadura atramentaria]|uniref:hypothetical protein n=1 Tax=Actinomadura atramentaria TaxID=1990 RepID=UPI0012F722E7|nr:hypothetical protein [Actinomadura atramentaria]
MTVDNGTGVPVIYRVRASRAGRRVELDTDQNMVTMREVKRDGTAVDTMRFPMQRIIAIREYSTADTASTGAPTPSPSTAEPTPTGEDNAAPSGDVDRTGDHLKTTPANVAVTPNRQIGRATAVPAASTQKGKAKRPGKRKR